MNRPIRTWKWIVALLAVAVVCPAAFAQKPAGAKRPVPKRPVQHRKLAVGVLEKADRAQKFTEASSRHSVVELLAFDPRFNWAKDIAFRHDIWALEFHFKPMRMIYVDIPQPGGVMKKKLIWYMVYSVTNPGKIMHPVEDLALPYKTYEGRTVYQVKYVDRPIRFIPGFKMYCPEFNKTYADRIIPIAVGPIRMREDRSRRFYTSVEMCREIAVGETVWGVATWMNIDQEIDRFSIYIKGLTNAYKWEDKAGGVRMEDPLGTGRRLSAKTLKLNFWRPGDKFYPTESEIRYGIPGEVDYEWVYR